MDGSTSVLVLLSTATFIGALVQATTGFGFAILAAPAFLAVLDSKSAIPVLIALHVVQSAILVPRVWRHAPHWYLMRLSLGAIAGCPLGLWLLAYLDVRTLKLTLGMLILAFVALFVARVRRPARDDGAPSRRTSVCANSGLTGLTGFASGLLTAILVMPGPPLMAFLASERWSQETARALSLTFFAGCYVAVLALAAIAGHLDGAGWIMIAKLAPAALIGTLVGMALAGRLSEAQYRTALLGLMLVSGLGAIVSAL